MLSFINFGYQLCCKLQNWSTIHTHKKKDSPRFYIPYHHGLMQLIEQLQLLHWPKKFLHTKPQFFRVSIGWVPQILCVLSIQKTSEEFLFEGVYINCKSYSVPVWPLWNIESYLCTWCLFFIRILLLDFLPLPMTEEMYRKLPLEKSQQLCCFCLKKSFSRARIYWLSATPGLVKIVEG